MRKLTYDQLAKRYKAVVKDNAWANGKQLEKDDCGHLHRSLDAAYKCLCGLRENIPDWHVNGAIHNGNGGAVMFYLVSENHVREEPLRPEQHRQIRRIHVDRLTAERR